MSLGPCPGPQGVASRRRDRTRIVHARFEFYWGVAALDTVPKCKSIRSRLTRRPVDDGRGPDGGTLRPTYLLTEQQSTHPSVLFLRGVLK